MADKAHLELLTAGADTWNAWRVDNPALKPDLRVADLSSKNLSGANPKYSNLAWADLREVVANTRI